MDGRQCCARNQCSCERRKGKLTMRTMETMQGTESCYDYTTLCCGVFMGYSWDIREIFMEYSWGIHMYRVCVGYVSGMCRESVGTNGMRLGSYSNFVQG